MDLSIDPSGSLSINLSPSAEKPLKIPEKHTANYLHEIPVKSPSVHTPYGTSVVEIWGLPPLILFFNMSIGWFGRFALSTEWYRTRRLDYKDLNWPRCSARVTESLALTDGGFCQKQTLYILDYVKIVSL